VVIGSPAPVDDPGVRSAGGMSALNFAGGVAAVPVVPVTGKGGTGTREGDSSATTDGPCPIGAGLAEAGWA
jgi:hypothetical protein